MSPRPVVSPREMAQEMRRKAEAAAGADRDYFLWLAGEWDRTAERERAQPAAERARLAAV